MVGTSMIGHYISRVEDTSIDLIGREDTEPEERKVPRGQRKKPKKRS